MRVNQDTLHASYDLSIPNMISDMGFNVEEMRRFAPLYIYWIVVLPTAALISEKLEYHVNQHQVWRKEGKEL